MKIKIEDIPSFKINSICINIDIDTQAPIEIKYNNLENMSNIKIDTKSGTFDTNQLNDIENRAIKQAPPEMNMQF